MAKIVMGIGASHTTLMNTQWDKVDHLPEAHAFRDALTAASSELHALRPDAVLVVGSNHFRGHWLDLMPAFTLGVDEIVASGEHGTPSGEQLCAPELALELANRLVDAEFDLAFSTRLGIDHGISHAIQYLTLENGIPIIPLMVNCFAPPLPKLSRCLGLGRAIRRAMEAMSDDVSIAVIASGGLSHQLPFPDWRKPESDNDSFLVDSWKNGRGDWEHYERRRRAIIVNAPPQLNEAFDIDLLQAFSTGRTEAWASNVSDVELLRSAGNGANEIRNWLIMHAALDFAAGKALAYSPMPDWLTGMGVFTCNPD